MTGSFRYAIITILRVSATLATAVSWYNLDRNNAHLNGCVFSYKKGITMEEITFEQIEASYSNLPADLPQDEGFELVTEEEE